MKKFIALTLALFALAACGVKGPLYFPAEEQTQTQQP
jgi:predicted small lipoprotein YifL